MSEQLCLRGLFGARSLGYCSTCQDTSKSISFPQQLQGWSNCSFLELVVLHIQPRPLELGFLVQMHICAIWQLLLAFSYSFPHVGADTVSIICPDKAAEGAQAVQTYPRRKWTVTRHLATVTTVCYHTAVLWLYCKMEPDWLFSVPLPAFHWPLSLPGLHAPWSWETAVFIDFLRSYVCSLPLGLDSILFCSKGWYFVAKFLS